ncbi:MAG: FtsX-like permease family protein [Coprococcus sp.]|nr:FtsX-like permease family protein [Coprococcus sp.]
MKMKSYIRLFKLSVKLYSANMKRNLYLTISVAVSIFLFLIAALFVDFEYATYVKGSKRVQENYIYISCEDKELYNLMQQQFDKKSLYLCMHTMTGGNLYIDKKYRIDIDYNIILTKNIPQNIYIHSNLEAHGETDNSNEYSFEKIELVCGADEFTSSNQVIISEEYACLLAGSAEDALGKKIMMGYNGAQDVYSVVGVYRQFLTETRLNKETVKEMESMYTKGNTAVDNTPLISTVIMPETAFSDIDISSYELYVFLTGKTEQQKSIYLTRISKFEEQDIYKDKFTYITPKDIETANQEEWQINMQTKAILLLIVAVISGISVFGTMINSVSDRRKEIGIKKALGASDGSIMLGFVFENLINSLIAIIIAAALAGFILLGYIFYQRQIVMSDYTVRFYGETILLFVIYTVSSVLGFSLLPAYSATQINIIDTLRDE